MLDVLVTARSSFTRWGLLLLLLLWRIIVCERDSGLRHLVENFTVGNTRALGLLEVNGKEYCVKIWITPGPKYTEYDRAA